MEMIIDLLLIAIVVVNIVDISGIVGSIKQSIGKWIKRNPDSISLKPFSCSYCMTWWSGLIYLIITGNLSLINVAILLLICAMTTVIGDMIYALRDFFGILPQIINKINNKMY